MAGGEFLFLDFDGVICDSVNETIASSWLAYHKYVQKHAPGSVARDHKARFMRLRPYIRTGRDYMLIQDLMARNVTVTGQDMFDELLAEAGKRRMELYKTAFYQARNEIMTEYKEYWLELNPLYPHMFDIMEQAGSCKNVYILSAKKIVYILEILKHHALAFPDRRIIHAGQEAKTDVIGRVLDREKGHAAFFVDDQISHLSANNDPRIKPLIASWGYVDSRRLEQTHVASIDPAGLRRLILRMVNSDTA
jgi:phosphoglycolate phosphatase-like HAD superfamily hydrolase